MARKGGIVTNFIDDQRFRSGRRANLNGGMATASRLLGNVRKANTPQAVFKIIRTGGCYNRADLKAQMNYVLGKSDHVIDPSSRHDGGKELTSRQVSRLAGDWAEGWRGKVENGNSMHLMMSFPKGTDIEKVKIITRGVCDELIGQGYGRWNYIAGIHTDREHPHAHIIVDRRNPDNELFYLAKDGELSYDRFKDAMVEWGRDVGVEMINTSRFSRGLTEEALSSIDLRKTLRGELIEHGKSPYAHDPKNTPSYYVKLATETGEKELWGSGLERALKEAGVQRGQELSITNRGKEVTSFTNRRGKDVAFTRTQWEVRLIGPVQTQDRTSAQVNSDFVQQRLSAMADTYRGLGSIAERLGNTITANALERLAQQIEKGEDMSDRAGAVQANPALERDVDNFEAKLNALRTTVTEIDRSIHQAPPEQRAQMDKELDDLLRSVRELNPLGEQTRTLTSPASDSIYAEGIARDMQRALSQAPERLEAALEGSGIDAREMAARIDMTASTFALESRWVDRDLRAVADKNGYDLSTGQGLADARDHISDLYDRIEAALSDQSLEQTARRVEMPEDEFNQAVEAEIATLKAEGFGKASISARSHEIEEGVRQRYAEERRPAIEVSAASEQADFGRLVQQLERTDFHYHYSDDSEVRMRGAESVTRAEDAFTDFALRSRGHAELASEAWDRTAADARGPQGYVHVTERTMPDEDVQRAFTIIEMNRARDQEERSQQAQDRAKAEALEEAMQLASKGGNLTALEARQLVSAVERALGADAARDMQNGRAPELPGMNTAQRHDFAAAYLRADQQLGREHSRAIAQHNVAAVRQEQVLRQERKGHEQNGHDFE